MGMGRLYVSLNHRETLSIHALALRIARAGSYNRAMPIRPLAPLLVNQIAAGEVIERPASVAKELIENAIDAGASRISIAIEQGGKELIRVTDDGCGIPIEELPLAPAPHATSKIAAAEDLDAIATMGFRGEALASIASISRLSILSRTAGKEGAGIIEGEGGAISEPRPAAAPRGTTVTVRNLFFNTPARRKFLKTEQTETIRICEIVENIALAHPATGFALTIDGRARFDLSTERSARRRVIDVLGDDLEHELLELDIADRGIAMWGMIGMPSIARGTAKHQRIYLNGRLISDRSISHAVKEAYRGLIEPMRFPMVVLQLQMEPATVDVNVHPAKAEVRFRNQAAVHGAVLSALRQRLREADLTPSFDLNRTTEARPVRAIPPAPPAEFGSGLPAQRERQSEPGRPGVTTDPRAFVDYFRRLDPKQKGFVYSELKQALAQATPEAACDNGDQDEPIPRDESARSTDESLPRLRAAASALQVHSSFIVTEDAQGLVIVDQHALHERVMFEKLRQRLDAGALESQRLLMPATIDADRRQLEALDSLQPLLARLGIEAEPIGPKSVAIHAFTSLLFERNVEPGAFLEELLDRAVNEGLNENPEAALHEVLDMMSCKAAIKAGDRLRPEEIDELLSYRETIERSSNCPHGRPTSLRLTIRDLEKQFGRR
jgi:DNA mismatch repair protein MutL